MVTPRYTAGPLSPALARQQGAAMDYVMHGWGIVPTTPWNGRHYVKGHTGERVATYRPALPLAYSLRDLHKVRSRYDLAPYGIALRAGEDVDALRAPTWLAMAAIARPEFRERFCPVVLMPAGVFILIEPGSTLRTELRGTRGVCLAESGTLIPLPPGRIAGGLLTWWVTPQQARWQPGNPDTVQAAIVTVLAEATDNDATGRPTS